MAKSPQASAPSQSSHSQTDPTDAPSGFSNGVSVEEVKLEAHKKRKLKSNKKKKKKQLQAGKDAVKAKEAEQASAEPRHAPVKSEGPLIIDGNAPRLQIHDNKQEGRHEDTSLADSNKLAGAIICMFALDRCMPFPHR